MVARRKQRASPPGDELIALNGLRVTAGNLESLVARATTGDVLEILVFRRDELLRFEVKLEAPRAEECTLAQAEKVTRAVAALSEGWLGAAR